MAGTPSTSSPSRLTDYEKNIDQLATEKYDEIVTVGFLMGNATAAKAKQYPNVKFAIVNNAYFPTKGSPVCDDAKKDCYADGGLKNVTSLMFQEDQVGCLAGVFGRRHDQDRHDLLCVRHGNPARGALRDRLSEVRQDSQTGRW